MEKCKVMAMVTDGQVNTIKELDCLLHADGKTEIVIRWGTDPASSSETPAATQIVARNTLKLAGVRQYILQVPLTVKSLDEFGP